MPVLYIAVFLILSMTISLAPWPPHYRRTGLWLAGGALLMSMVLSWQVQTVSGSWFALTQKLELLARSADSTLSRWLAGQLNPLVVLLAVAGHLGFPGLPHALAVAVVYLFLYLLVKGCLLPLLYLLQRRRAQVRGFRPRRWYWQTRTATNLLVLVLTPPLVLLPLAATSPVPGQLVWAGAWLLLLELRLWASRRSPR